MAICTLNSIPVSLAEISIPKIGAWHADLSVETVRDLTGKATIVLMNQTYKGTIVKGGVDSSGKMRVRVIAGNAGLSKIVEPRSYLQVPLRIPLNHALADSGETLALNSDPDILNLQLPAWSRLRVSAGTVIGQLLQAVTTTTPSWRLLLDGTLWVGFESWPPGGRQVIIPGATIDSRVAVLDTEPERDRITIASGDPSILPGTTLDYHFAQRDYAGAKVSYIRHTVNAFQGFRSLIYFE